VLVAKLVSTAASVGSGANGGILTPTLFMGAAFGALFADILHVIDPHLTSQLAAYAVVGMGAFLAATTHAPLTSILLIFEMTLDYEVVLPLMLACVTAHYVARIYRRGESVYTRALKASGPGDEDEWRLRQITALIRPPAWCCSGTSVWPWRSSACRRAATTRSTSWTRRTSWSARSPPRSCGARHARSPPIRISRSPC
jgi:CIC family chloride channel protein